MLIGYRKLALEYHPDKISINSTDEEIASLKYLFFAVQDAHEILTDSVRRMKYDLTLLGYTSETHTVPPRYSEFPFSLDLRSNLFSMHFRTSLSRQVVKTIVIIEEIDLSKIFNIVTNSKSFYRQIPCPACNGTGGDNLISCRPCTLCGGNGHAGHTFSDATNSFIHVMKGTCSNCGGLGCIPSGKCHKCGGSGMILEEGVVSYELPIGFPDGFTLVFLNEGHRMTDGRIGNVSISYRYRVPEGWKLVPGTLNLVFTMEISVQQIVEGFQRDILCPNGRLFQVLGCNDL